MPFRLPIFLAYGESSVWDAIIWLVAGIFWLVIQIANAKNKKEKQAQRPHPPAAAPGGGDAPTADELAEIFKRLGGQIPATPPPVPRPAPPPTPRPAPAPAPQMARKPAQPIARKPAAARIQPVLAQRLAKAKQEAAEAAAVAEAERIAVNAIVHGVQSQAGEHRSLDTATRHTGMILPRLYAMSMRLVNLPTMPMPALNPAHREALPLRARLRTRREVRNAIVAQAFLSPCKSATL